MVVQLKLNIFIVIPLHAENPSMMFREPNWMEIEHKTGRVENIKANSLVECSEHIN